MNKFLFIDLDETLIHADYNNFSKRRIRVDFDTDTGGWGEKKTESYGVIPRPNVHEFLKSAHLIYPNVYMLTAATTEYGIKMNNACNLGFKENEIIGRDMWNVFYMMKPDYYKFTSDPCVSVLIDNQHPSLPNAKDKIEYLQKFGKAAYIQCPGFFGYPNGGFTDKIINKLINETEACFNQMIQ